MAADGNKNIVIPHAGILKQHINSLQFVYNFEIVMILRFATMFFHGDRF